METKNVFQKKWGRQGYHFVISFPPGETDEKTCFSIGKEFCENYFGDRYEYVMAVTNRSLCQRPFAEQIERVCSLHPKAVILREKDLPEEEYSRLAEQILEICKRYQVPCILHTYVNVAEKLHHPYIHLPIFLLEKYEGKLGGFRQIGSSIHSVEDALKAESLGADYLTAGHIYTTDCKKGLPPRGLEFLENVCKAVKIPVYAIGGIHPGTGQLNEIMEHGSAGGCIMSDMMKI